MAGLNLIATVTVDATAPGLTQVGFGTLMIATCHNKFPGAERVRTYTDPAQLITDGFLATDPTYLMVARAFSANPRPVSVKVGRRDLNYTQTTRLTPIDASANVRSEVKISKGSQSVTATFTPGAPSSVAAICADLVADITAAAITGLTATNNTTHITITCTAGQMAFFSNWLNLKYEDLTADPGIATDLAAIQLYDGDWYGLAIDSRGRLEQEEASDWIATQIKINKVATSDWQAPDAPSVNDISYVLKSKTYFRTECLFELDDTAGFSDVALLACELTMDPGSYTNSFKALPGVTSDKLNDTQITNLKAKNYTLYVQIAGLNMTLGGKSAGGEWCDVVRGLDWLKIRMQERIVALQAGNKKIPFTTGGITMVGNEVKGQLSDGVTVGLLADDPAPTVFLPNIKSISTIDKQNRTLNGIKFGGTLQGAIHFVAVQGSVTA